MNIFKDKKKRRIFLWISVPLLIIAILFSACAIYVSDYYRADLGAIEAFSSFGAAEQVTLKDGTIAFEPKNAKVGFIFYPGGKVEYTAYIPLMKSLSSMGIMCALVEMPFNLAVLDINAADEVKASFPQIEHWYIGGHSLGGSMAASYVSEHADEFEGLVLLGSYSTADLTDTSLSVLSIYGSEDGVMNKEKYDSSRSNLPSTLHEEIIKGGNHAFFGMYGAQEGDGTPSISNSEQIYRTALSISLFMISDGILK